MKIHIYYRHYNISEKEPYRPEWFDYSKIFQNFISTLIRSSNDYKFNLIMDGYVKDNFIKKYDYIFTDKIKYNIHEIEAGSDKNSFFKTCEIIKNDNIKEGDLIYFLENDYIHTPNWMSKVFELFQTYSGLNYVSLYDHKDKYFLPQYDNLVSKIFITNSHHWRTTPSTCGSFIIKKDIFDQDYDILSTMEGDHNKFLWLNENRNRFVISPIPSISTHCMEGLLGPTINWEKLI